MSRAGLTAAGTPAAGVALGLMLGLLLGTFAGARVARAGATRERTGTNDPGHPEEPDNGHDQHRGLGGLRRQATGEAPTQVLGYVCAPQLEDAVGPSLEAQADAIQRLCEQRGWTLTRVVRDVETVRGKALQRPGLLYALERIAEGDAACLVVPRLERVVRSAAEVGRIVEAIEDCGARLVAMDLRLDTGTTQGRLTARTLATVAEWESRWIANRTRKGLAAARARGATTGPAAVADRPEIKELIVELRKEGLTLQAIADRLNSEGVPTLRGGTKWRPSSVEAATGYRRPPSRRAGTPGGDGRTEHA